MTPLNRSKSTSRPLLGLLTSSLLLTGPLLATQPGAGVATPFAPSTRWSLDSTTTIPWIPRSVDFAVRGELVWAAPSVSNPHLLLSSTAGDGSTGTLLEDHSLAGAIGPVLVRAGDRIDELFSVAQFADSGKRRTVVMGHDPRPAAITSSDFVSSWTYDPGLLTDRPPFLECGPSAEYVVCATYANGEVHLDWLDTESGLRNSRVTVSGSALNAMAYSESTERVAVVAGLDLWLVDRLGNILVHEVLQASTKALALSENGAVIAYGDFGSVHVHSEAGGVFAQGGDLIGQAMELPTRIALDGDGTNLAVGWWNFVNGMDVRLQVIEVGTNQVRVTRSQVGATGSPQNFPEAVKLSADGTRAAFGLWGLSDSQPELYLIDVDSDADLFAEDLPGSVQALALDESGTRVALGLKHGHANDFGTTGSVQLFDSGERDLQLMAPPVRGGSLATRMAFPDQLFTILAIGNEAAQGTVFGDWNGLAYLDLNQPIFRRATLADGNGFSALELGIPDDPGLVGLSFAIQAIFVTSSDVTLSDAILRPTIF